jgi:4-amino-4-deoxy-L-arabinose transferase-like glycosyltransferase
MGVLAIAVMLISTPRGAGLGGDSYYYVSGARDLLAGEGFSRPAADGTFRPITHFPPLFSVCLALLTALGLDTMQAARLFNATLFGANVVLLGWLLWRGTRSGLLSLGGALVFLAAPAMLAAHSWVLSEPLFLCCLLLAIGWLSFYLERGRRRDLVLAAILASFACLTRYVGLALVAAAVLAVLLLPGRWCWKRMQDAAGFAVLSLAAPAGWFARNLALVGSPTNRALQFHLPDSSKLLEALDTFSLWLLPGRVPSTLRVGLAAVVTLGLLALTIMFLWKGSPSGERRPVPWIAGWLLLVYPLSILASLSLLDASTPLDDRILSPLLVAGLLLGICTANEVMSRDVTGRPARVILGTLLAGFVALGAARGVGKVLQLRADGQGYASRGWRDSQLVAWVNEHPDKGPIYSNELDALYLLTGRQAYQVPIHWDPVQAEERQDFPEQLARMRERITREGAILILFNTLASQQAFLPSEAELAEGLQAAYRTADGVVYVGGR